jgi:hypothetical protein
VWYDGKMNIFVLLSTIVVVFATFAVLHAPNNDRSIEVQGKRCREPFHSQDTAQILKLVTHKDYVTLAPNREQVRDDFVCAGFSLINAGDESTVSMDVFTRI